MPPTRTVQPFTYHHHEERIRDACGNTVVPFNKCEATIAEINQIGREMAAAHRLLEALEAVLPPKGHWGEHYVTEADVKAARAAIHAAKHGEIT